MRILTATAISVFACSFVGHNYGTDAVNWVLLGMVIGGISMAIIHMPPIP